MIKGNQREKYLKEVLINTGIKWITLLDDYTDYPEANAQFHMYIVKKASSAD
jgi:hypothetical protein